MTFQAARNKAYYAIIAEKMYPILNKIKKGLMFFVGFVNMTSHNLKNKSYYISVT